MDIGGIMSNCSHFEEFKKTVVEHGLVCSDSCVFNGYLGMTDVEGWEGCTNECTFYSKEFPAGFKPGDIKPEWCKVRSLIILEEKE